MKLKSLNKALTVKKKKYLLSSIAMETMFQGYRYGNSN